MQQKIAVGIILAFIVFSAVVFVLYQQQEAQPPPEDNLDEIFKSSQSFVEEDLVPVERGSILLECGTQESEGKRDLCWLFEATAEVNAAKCMNIVERPARIDCLRTVAVDTEGSIVEKLGVCDQYLSDDEPQRFMCHSTVAKEFLEYSICEAMPEQPNNYKAHCISIVDGEFS